MPQDFADLLAGREVIIEFHTIGSYVKISAVDVKSTVEISVQGPVSTDKKILRQNALRRLEYVLKKKNII